MVEKVGGIVRVKVMEKGWEFIKRKKDTYADSRMLYEGLILQS